MSGEGGFAFHAAPPDGRWFNDPTGLVHAGGRWRLFVQHRDDPPGFVNTGWARLSSDDLLGWDWDGPVLAPDADGWAYSGCVRAAGEGRLEAYLTRHARPPASAWEVQRRVVSEDAGLTWRPALLESAPEGRNLRDPFVFDGPGGLNMLLAEPCDWTDWAAGPPSRLQVLASEEGAIWRSVGVIGPWAPPGVLSEMPQLVRFGEVWALIVSVVDRRSGGSDCGVVYWTGAYDGAAFTRDPGQPPGGRPLDLGPDFYAAILDTPGLTAPISDPLLVAWASNWGTARRHPWPGGMAGGPITLPRRLTLNAEVGRLEQRPVPAPVAHAAAFDGDRPFALRLSRGDCEAMVELRPDANTVAVQRAGGDAALVWAKRWAGLLGSEGKREVSVYADGPLIELFVHPEGLSITMVLGEGALPLQVAVEGG